MWAALRYRFIHLPKSSVPWNQNVSFMSTVARTDEGLLNLQDVEKVLSDVRADDVKVIPVGKQCDWTDFMVVATGRSTWHVKNIAQALIYKAKLKQKEIGARRLMLPSVQGQETGKWVVIDSGKVIVHALDEKARAYYNLENLWTMETSKAEPAQDLEKAFLKVRPKNNSKKRPQTQRNV
ncbi:protein Iojap-related, mitochondrial [Mangifera indica]|uniref:protein Iojap-related, mitochondrial n=1 Tax=Mangifera indica TaxID=29780 RepID=UPI001CFADA26|nr:protein Iojap-related, mitochondrial [Mangifera indica]